MILIPTIAIIQESLPIFLALFRLGGRDYQTGF